MSLIFRPAEAADAIEVAAVSLATGQPANDSGADPRYFELLLRDGVVVVAALEGGGPVVGWGATRRTGFGEILSDLFVDPGHHGRGVGARLLRMLWPDGPAAPGRLTFSSRHPSALPLYARAGLRPVWPLLYLTGEPTRLPPEPSVRASRVEASASAAAEARLTSAPERTAEYTYWAGGPAATGVLVHRGDQLLAAGAGHPGELVHLTCVSEPPDAVAATTAALHVLGGAVATICIPGPHPALGHLLSHGWRVEDYDLAMTTPDVNLPTTWIYSPGLA